MKTLSRTILVFIFSLSAIGFIFTFSISIYINTKLISENNNQSIHSVHKSVSEVIGTAIRISDFSELQKTLGQVSKGNRKYGVYLTSGEWILPDYELQKYFEDALDITDLGLNCKLNKAFGEHDLFCSSIESNAFLVSLEPTKQSIWNNEIVNVWLIVALILPLFIIIFASTYLFHYKIIRPFLKLHEDINNLNQSKKYLNELKDVSIKSTFDFLEFQNITSAINGLLANIVKANIEIQRREKDAITSHIARQVAHDIRSPLSALNMLVGSLQNISEEKRIILRNAAQRINDIANNLLLRSNNLSSQNTKDRTEISIESNSKNSLQSGAGKKQFVELAPALIDSLVSEKRMQYANRSGIDIECDLRGSSGAYIKINSVEIKRALSNLIDNAIEAVSQFNAKIVISVRRHKNLVQIQIVDNGRGMNEEVLSKLGKERITSGKNFDGASDMNSNHGGSGIGYLQAKHAIESSGGSITVQSKLGVGTALSIQFSLSETPAWYVHGLELNEKASVVILDDDESIHDIWRSRLKGISQLSVIHLKSIEDFTSWCESNSINISSSLFLIDFEFIGQTINGVDLIEKYGISQHSILVTSHSDEQPLRDRVTSSQVRMIPKSMANLVPIIKAISPAETTTTQ